MAFDEESLKDLISKLKPYEDLPEFKELPRKGISENEIIELLNRILEKENETWEKGYVSGAVYHGGKKHIEFNNRIYSIASQVNPLHPDIWPSALKIEREVVAMTASLLNYNEAIGNVTSGGTESILLAMKTYRDVAKKKGINEPEIVLPISAHAAFDKASHYFGIKLRYVNLDEKFKADIEEIKKLINERTIALVASAPCFPYGTIDPIKEMSEIAKDKKIYLHVDACLGGFILPFAEKLGYNIEPFDFRLEGVSSISVDTHKYGYAPKGTSVILYRDVEIWKNQLYINTSWCGGIYFSTTLLGSRAGALIYSAWATMLRLGYEGYMKNANKILKTAELIKKKIKELNELEILGDPLWVIAISSKIIDPYSIASFMQRYGWNLNLLQNPRAFHIAITLKNANRTIAGKFLKDLENSIELAKKEKPKGLAPIYGMLSSLPEGSSKEIISSLIEFLQR